MNSLKKIIKVTSRIAGRELGYQRVIPANLLFFLTYRCTSSCRTCVMWKRKPTAAELTLQEWRGLVDKIFARYRIRNVELFGGDALLRKDVLIPLARYLKHKGVPRVELATNGNLLDERTARELVSAGIDTFYVSVDAIGPAHDRIRGVKGSFERVKRAIEFLVKAKEGAAGTELFTQCTVSSLNFDSIEKILPWAEGIGMDTLAFEYVGEFPRGSLDHSMVNGIGAQPYFVPQNGSLLLNRAQAGILKAKLKDLKKVSGSCRIKLVTKNIDSLTIENMASGKFAYRKCYVCRYQLTVDPYGNIIPCPFFGDYHLGNISRADLSSCWNNTKHRDFIKAVAKGKVELCRYCILNVERNPTVLQSLRRAYLAYTRGGLDE